MSTFNTPAISIRQPWAELILRNQKTIEIRNWSDDYRGPLWLHTGKERAQDQEVDAIYGKLFRGGYVGRIVLDTIVPFDRERWELWRSEHLDTSDYRAGLFAWVISSAIRFKQPVPGPGQLGIYYPNPDMSRLLLQAFDESNPESA